MTCLCEGVFLRPWFGGELEGGNVFLDCCHRHLMKVLRGIRFLWSGWRVRLLGSASSVEKSALKRQRQRHIDLNRDIALCGSYDGSSQAIDGVVALLR